MKYQDLYQLFVGELADMYSAEHQIIEVLPKIIKLVSLPDLKEGLAHHLKETENQAKRIEEIYFMLDITIEEITCEGMEGILKEANEITKNKTKSPLLDAAIISALQKVEHYEIASYRTLRSFAKHLDLDNEIVDLIQDSLDEEENADKIITKLAEGSFFSSGINEEAKESSENRK